MTNYRAQIVACVSDWILAEFALVHREEHSSSPNVDASDDMIRLGRERVMKLRAIREQIENL